MLFNAVLACSASSCVEKRTKPKPRLRFVSRSLTTTCTESDVAAYESAIGRELPPLQFGHTAETLLSASDRWYARPGLYKDVNELTAIVQQCTLTYPMNNFVVGFCAMAERERMMMEPEYAQVRRVLSARSRIKAEEYVWQVRGSLSWKYLVCLTRVNWRRRDESGSAAEVASIKIGLEQTAIENLACSCHTYGWHVDLQRFSVIVQCTSARLQGTRGDAEYS